MEFDLLELRLLSYLRMSWFKVRFFLGGGRLNRLGTFEEIHAPDSAAASPYSKVKNSLLLAHDEWAIPL